MQKLAKHFRWGIKFLENSIFASPRLRREKCYDNLQAMPKKKPPKSTKIHPRPARFDGMPLGTSGEASVPVQKSHPWRLCPAGQHWVRTHPLHVLPSKRNPDGITTRHGHCANNPSKKDSIQRDEIQAIAEEYFSSLTGPPNNNNLGYPKNKGNPYDHFIRGWTKYWNEVFKPQELLDPDLIKALVGSESSFNPKPPAQQARGAGNARGLIQLTDQAIKVLGNAKGELKDHLVHLNKEDALDPNISICAGIRWLFHKKKLASIRLKREATWEEAIAEYKSYLRDMISGKNPNPKGMKKFRENLTKLKKNENPNTP